MDIDFIWWQIFISYRAIDGHYHWYHPIIFSRQSTEIIHEFGEREEKIPFHFDWSIVCLFVCLCLIYTKLQVSTGFPSLKYAHYGKYRENFPNYSFSLDIWLLAAWSWKRFSFFFQLQLCILLSVLICPSNSNANRGKNKSLQETVH